jgi:hypothetical protein
MRRSRGRSVRLTGRSRILKLADVPTQTFKGRTAASTGIPQDLTATEATAILNAVVGDSGAGGTKGLVPAPATGDAAANKVLKADGAWGLQEVFAHGIFNGATGALVAGMNIASGSKLSSGEYEVTMATAAASVNYTINATARIVAASGTAVASVSNTTTPTTTVFRVRTHILTAAPSIGIGDVDFLYVSVFQ